MLLLCVQDYYLAQSSKVSVRIFFSFLSRLKLILFSYNIPLYFATQLQSMLTRSTGPEIDKCPRSLMLPPPDVFGLHHAWHFLTPEKPLLHWVTLMLLLQSNLFLLVTLPYCPHLCRALEMDVCCTLLCSKPLYSVTSSEWLLASQWLPACLIFEGQCCLGSVQVV